MCVRVELGWVVCSRRREDTQADLDARVGERCNGFEGEGRSAWVEEGSCAWGRVGFDVCVWEGSGVGDTSPSGLSGGGGGGG